MVNLSAFINDLKKNINQSPLIYILKGFSAVSFRPVKQISTFHTAGYQVISYREYSRSQLFFPCQSSSYWCYPTRHIVRGYFSQIRCSVVRPPGLPLHNVQAQTAQGSGSLARLPVIFSQFLKSSSISR